MTRPPRKMTILAAGAAVAVAATLIGVGALALPAAPAQAEARPEMALQARPDAQAPAAVRFVRSERLNQTPPPPPPGPPGPRPPRGPRDGDDPDQHQQQMQQRRDAFLDSLAGHLGVSRDQLGTAFKQSRIDQINQAAAAGRIDQNRANQMIQAIQNSPAFAGPMGPGRPGGPGAGPRQGGPPPGPGQDPNARRGGPPGGPEDMRGGGMFAANVLGLSPEELRSQFQAGKSLAQIAQDKGMSRDELKSKLIDAQKARLDQAVANGRITPDQAQQIAARFAANVDRMIDMKPGEWRGPGGPPGRSN